MAFIMLKRCPATLSTVTLNEASRLLSRLIDQCEELKSPNNWELNPTTQKRSRSEARFKLCHSDQHGIKILLKPGQNDSAWEYNLVPPSDVKQLVALRIFGLWDGWTGHEPPKAYRATLEENQGDAEEEEQSFYEEPAKVSSPVVSPAMSPAVVAKPVALPMPPPVGDAALAVLQGLADTLASAARLKAEIYELQDKATEYESLALKHMAAAEEESKKAETIGKEIAAKRARLNDPKILAAQSAIAGLQALMNEGK